MSSERITGTALRLALGLVVTIAACGEDPAQPGARLEGDVAEVRGTVVLETGAGLPGATVELARNGGVARSTETDANGRYAIGIPEAGTWELRLKPPVGYALSPDAPGTVSVDIAAGKVVTMDLGAVHNLWVQVGVDSATAVVGVPVSVFPAGESDPVATGQTGNNGKALFALEPGSYDVLIDIPAGYALMSLFTNPQGVVVPAEAAEYVRFWLERTR